MTDKTCGTCGHCTMIHDRYAVASCVCNIACRIDSGGYNCLRSVCSKTKPCGDYIERTDSLEQVTLEMWRDLGRSIKYADRLRALGVEVSQ